MDAEQVASSPSGEHSLVFSGDAGSTLCQYSMPRGIVIIRWISMTVVAMPHYREILDERTMMTVREKAWNNEWNVRNTAESYGCEPQDDEWEKKVPGENSPTCFI